MLQTNVLDGIGKGMIGGIRIAFFAVSVEAGPRDASQSAQLLHISFRVRFTHGFDGFNDGLTALPCGAFFSRLRKAS